MSQAGDDAVKVHQLEADQARALAHTSCSPGPHGRVSRHR